MLSGLHSKLCNEQYNKKIALHLIVAPQLSSGWQHNYSNKTRPAGWANELSMYSLMSMVVPFPVSSKPPPTGDRRADALLPLPPSASHFGSHRTGKGRRRLLEQAAQRSKS
jgi:hypothetical protein